MISPSNNLLFFSSLLRQREGAKLTCPRNRDVRGESKAIKVLIFLFIHFSLVSINVYAWNLSLYFFFFLQDIGYSNRIDRFIGMNGSFIIFYY